MIGIDEVGRGAWAGPLLVVAARQVLSLPTGLDDSKVLSKKRRQSLYFDIDLSCDIGEGWVEPSEIDDLGLTGAMRLAVERSLVNLDADTSEEIIVDGNINYCSSTYINARAVIGADALYPIVSAASIYAKVTRDTFMAKQAMIYKGYGFDKHVGYGTKLHKEALVRLGLLPIHRKSFRPIQKFSETKKP